MKIRIIKNFKTPKGQLREGDIVDVQPKTAERWNAEGKCIYLKIVSPKEVK